MLRARATASRCWRRSVRLTATPTPPASNKSRRGARVQYPIQSPGFRPVNCQAVLLPHSNHPICEPALVLIGQPLCSITASFLMPIDGGACQGEVQEVGGELTPSSSTRRAQAAVVRLRLCNHVLDISLARVAERPARVRSPHSPQVVDDLRLHRTVGTGSPMRRSGCSGVLVPRLCRATSRLQRSLRPTTSTRLQGSPVKFCAT